MRAGYGMRAPREDDLPAVVDTVKRAERSQDPTAAAREEDEFRRGWSRMSLAEDAWVATAPGGEVCGYGHVVAAPAEGRVFGDAYTHPDHLGAGIGSALVSRMEARAARMAGAADRVRVGGEGEPAAVLVNYVRLGGAADRMLRARGYRLARVHQRMRRDLDGPLPAPVWPEGVGLRSCDGSEADLRRVHACVEGAFADRWGRLPRDYDHWAADIVHDGFDPSLWLVAERDGELLGASLNRLCEVGGQVSGEVEQLGVARAARRMGLGRALLLAGFTSLAGRGAGSVGLDVDSESPTGAHLLYAQVGMSTTLAIGQFEVEVAPAGAESGPKISGRSDE